MRLAGPFIEVEEVSSTQDAAKAMLQAGEPVGAVFAHHQTAGRGRFGRAWQSKRCESLTMSLVIEDVHPEAPWLVGMAAAVAVAETIDCRLRWPNDLVLGLDLRKVGGVLTELERERAVVGIGLNVKQTEFAPELAQIATSLRMEFGREFEIKKLALAIVSAIEAIEARSWQDLAPRWNLRDSTEGKIYVLPEGREIRAVCVGSCGELIAKHNGQELRVLAADALW